MNRIRFLKWPHALILPSVCPDKGTSCPYLESLVPKEKEFYIKRKVPPIKFWGKVVKGDNH